MEYHRVLGKAVALGVKFCVVCATTFLVHRLIRVCELYIVIIQKFRIK